MEAFLQAMTDAGFEVKHGRGGAISFRAEGVFNLKQMAATLQYL